MGVEPTAARSARPASGFEDRGGHRATTTPVRRQSYRAGAQRSSALNLTVQSQRDIFCGAGRSNLKWLHRTIRSGLPPRAGFSSQLHGALRPHHHIFL